MLAHYNSIVAMLNAEKSMLGPEHPSLDQSRQSQVDHFKRVVSHSPVDPATIAAVYAKLQDDTDNPFTTAQRQSIAESLSAHSRSASLATSAHLSDNGMPKDQKHLHFHNYMTDELWQIQLDTTSGIEHKLRELAKFAQTVVGLVKPCERTALAIKGIA